MAEVAPASCLEDRRCDRRGCAVVVADQVSLGNLADSELGMHVNRRFRVREAMALPRGHTLLAGRKWRQEHDVVDIGDTCGGGQDVEEPGADHPVKDDGVASAGEL